MQRKNRSSFMWWAMFVFHNCVAHPLLVIGEIADHVSFIIMKHVPRWRLLWLAKVCQGVWSITVALHDKTIPDGDTMNLVTQLRTKAEQDHVRKSS